MKSKLVKIILTLSIPMLMGAGCSIGGSGPLSSALSSRSADGGMWVSHDQAETWEQKNFVRQEKKNTITIGGYSINHFVFHPLDSRIIYASSEKGIYYTENAGDQWAQYLPGSYVAEIAPDPAIKGVVYVAQGNKVIKTVNNGETWDDRYVESRPGVNVTQIAIDPVDTKRVYAGTSGGDLLISDDAGLSWNASDAKFLAPVVELLVSPFDNRILYVATQNKGISVTGDRGITWVNTIESLKEYPGANDFKRLVIDETRPDTLLYASKYGLMWTYDNGKNFQPIELLTPPGSININALAISPETANTIYYANESVFYRTFDGGKNWIAEKLPTGRAPTSILVDFHDPNNVYLSVQKIKK